MVRPTDGLFVAFSQTRADSTRRQWRPLGARPLLLFLLGFCSVRANPPLMGKSGFPPTGIEESSQESKKITLPPGTFLYLRQGTGVSTTGSHLHDTLTARTVREVRGRQGIAIPIGAVVHGRIEKLIPSSNPTDRARVLLRFTHLEIPGQAPIMLNAHVKEVENARESVMADGTIQGVLASELPLAHLEEALRKLGKGSEDVQKVEERALGKPDTSIEYPVGTDLVLVLDQPLTLDDGFKPAVPDVLAGGINAAVERLMAEAPRRASSKDRAPGDPLNLVVIGNADEIRQAFEEGGWSKAESNSPKSIWETIRAVIAEKGYGAAPVSQLYVYGRPEDLAFEKMLNTFMKRHHLRLWRSPAKTPEGREIWLGGATHDTGLDVRPGVISHAIDPDLDAERTKVGADLLISGRVAAESLVTRPEALNEGLTATGAPWKTDGKLLAIELKPQ